MAGIKSKLFGVLTPCTIGITFDDAETRQKVDITYDSTASQYHLFTANDPVVGKISLKPLPGKKVEHAGIRVEFIGQIQITYDRTEKFDFIALSKELEGPGEFDSEKVLPFEFSTVEKAYDSYNGLNARLRYFLRVTVVRNYTTNVVQEQDIWVQNLGTAPEVNNSIKMEVGIEDCLHIEFEYDKSKYHLHDVVLGKIFFLLVRIKIKHMELAIIKRESTGSGPNLYNESETVVKYEIMDGAPVRGESIPVRMFLGAYKLTPTMRAAQRLSVRYYINLVLVDEEDRRYFKQQEIVLYRDKLGN